MERRTIIILIATLSVATLLLCGLAGGGVWLALRSIERQNRTADVFATINAGLATVESAQPTEDPREADDPATATPAPTPLPNEPLPTVVVPTVAVPTAGPAPAPEAALAAPFRSLPAQQPNQTYYQIDAQLFPDQRTIVGAETIHYTNTEDVALGTIYFRLPPNAPHYREGSITVSDIQVNGQATASALELDDTALRVTLPQPLGPGQGLLLSLRFTTSVPDEGGNGIFGLSDGVFALYNWHPELDVYENGGWLLNPIGQQGDPTNTDVASYAVRFAAPTGYTIITSGMETQRDGDRQVVVQAESMLTRNFVVVASDRFVEQSRQVGDTTITSYYLPGSEQGSQTALEAAARAVELYSQRFGPYAFPELDLAEVQLGEGAAGMEATGLIMLGSDYYDPARAVPLAGFGGLVEGAEDVNLLAFVTAHEVAHQWWYSVVGNDAYREPWLDESLTNWSAALYMDEQVSANAGQIARDLLIGLPYRELLARTDMQLDQPTDQFSESEYSAVVYGKGALMYDVLRQQIGDEPFFTFLQRYYAEHQFGRVDGAGWLATLAGVIGQDAAQTFYDKWVSGSAVTPADLPPPGPVSQLFSSQPQATPAP